MTGEGGQRETGMSPFPIVAFIDTLACRNEPRRTDVMGDPTAALSR